MEIGVAEAQRIEVGCEMRLPSPLDVSVAKKLQIQLGSNEEDPEGFFSGSGDYFEDSDGASGLFSGEEEIELNGKWKTTQMSPLFSFFFIAETMEDYD